MKSMCALLVAMLGLAICAARADDPKSYRINISDVRAGDVDLAAGDYKVLIHRDEGKVQMMELNTGKVFDVAAKVETKDSKFDFTEVHTQNVDGVNVITEIRIAGTKFLITFRKSS